MSDKFSYFDIKPVDKSMNKQSDNYQINGYN